MLRQEQLTRYLWQSKPQQYKNPSLKCPHCKGTELIKRGLRTTLNRGKLQRYECKKCTKRFIKNDGFYRMRNDSQKITATLDMYYNGMSLRKCQSFLKTHYPHNASHMTVLRWIRKYAQQISKLTDNVKVNNSNCITFDEVEYRTKGTRSWFIPVMDLDNRFILSSDYTTDRSLGTFITLLSNAKRKGLCDRQYWLWYFKLPAMV